MQTIDKDVLGQDTFFKILRILIAKIIVNNRGTFGVYLQ